MLSGDLVTIESTGAYCASMSTKNYNSFPEAAEVLLDNGTLHLIRRYLKQHEQFVNYQTCTCLCDLLCILLVHITRRQTLEQVIENEVALIL